MKRYYRQPDELACPEAVLDVLRSVARRLDLPQMTSAELVKLAHSIHNFLKYPLKHTGRCGRKGKYERALLNRAAALLSEILAERTGNRVSPMRFCSRYVPIIRLPEEVKTALVKHEITLEEAHLLARLSARNLKGDATRAERLRNDLLSQHLKYKFGQTSLRVRVREILGEIPVRTVAEVSEKIKEQVAVTDALLELDAYDTTHLLFEGIKNLFFMTREIEDADLDDKLTEEILDRIGELQASLHKALKRKSQRLVDSDSVNTKF